MSSSKSIEEENVDSENIESKKIENDSSSSSEKKPLFPLRKRLAGYQRLASEEKVFKRSINTVTFAAFCMAMNIKILQPNYAIMAAPGAHPESFENTNPFSFNSATYFIPMTSAIGMAIASIFTGTMSDKQGRKPILLICTIGCGIGGVVKFLCRKTFWGFCVTNFITGLLSGGLPVALGYVSDVYTTEDEKSKGFSGLVSFWMFGQSFGGILAILLEATGLFAPLLLGSAFMAISAILIVTYMVEAGDITYVTMRKASLANEDNQKDDLDLPEEIDQRALQNIVWGAFFDNLGSQALFPLCLSPLALEQFYMSYASVGEDPVMTLDAYKWLSVLVALMVIPSAVLCPKIFQKVGAAAACVAGNFMTGIITISLLYLGSGEPSSAMFAGFVSVLYLGFPCTVVSQLSTSPMLDMIAPLDKRGYVQGINSTVMNFGIAVGPWALGIMADIVGTKPTIWTGAAISFFAGLVNTPLIFRKGFGPPQKVVPQQRRPVSGEDKDLIDKILRGSHVSPEDIRQVNEVRREKGLPYLTVRPKPYSEDKDNLGELKRRADPELRYWKYVTDEYLTLLNEKDESLPSIIEQLNVSRKTEDDDEDAAAVHREIGEWFVDYLKDAGYQVHQRPLLIKQLILLAFPVLCEEKEITFLNFETHILRIRRLLDQYVKISGKTKIEKEYTLEAMTGNGMIPFIYG